MLHRKTRIRFVPAALVALLLVAVLAGIPGPAARGSVPTGDPVFSDPLNITNTFFPFVPGATKVYRGKSDGERIYVIDRYMTETRTFTWKGQTVTCRGLQEVEFEDGELVEISTNWFAQATNGAVYYFGETVDNYEDGEIVDHEGAWLVGGPAPGEEAVTADDPSLFMPADPEVGDVWKPENVPALDIEETDTVRKVGKTVTVEAGRFEGCIKVKELDFDGETEKKYYAPGVGVIKAKADGEKLELVAMTPLDL
jgi:hypothetical protein